MIALPELTPELLDGLVGRAARADFRKFLAQLRSSGNCCRPVRLRGTITTCDAAGRRRVWSTTGEPDGVLRKACGNRREAVCPACAERYRGDAFQLIAAGMRGGKGVPDSVSEHPAVFLTLTAPSFGPVHTRALGPDGEPRPCRARRDRPVCPHGRTLYCTARHEEHEECLGEPLCGECFDYRAAVVWNHLLGELWRYTTIYVKRALAREAGLTQAACHREVRVAYARVAEYQRRGLVHLHVLARLDKAMPDYRADELRAPSKRFGVELLERAVRSAVACVEAPVKPALGGGCVRWGDALDIHALTSGAQRSEIAGYLAKYSTKSTELAGALLHPVAAEDVERAPVREHVRGYMRAAVELHEHATDERSASRLIKSAHALGYRGHCLTKSRRYSTTFKQLRADREAWVHAQLLARSNDAAQRALAGAVERIAEFEVEGIGHVTAADEYYALAEHNRARERRRAAREALAIAVPDRGSLPKEDR